MRKCVALILVLLYFNASTGMPVHVHYCMGKMQSWSLGFAKDKNRCDDCGMHQKKGCCEDKQTILKTSENHKPVANVSCNVNLSTITPTFEIINTIFFHPLSAKIFAVISSHWKPDSIYKLHCVFLI